jgi:hypothetical protein
MFLRRKLTLPAKTESRLKLNIFEEKLWAAAIAMLLCCPCFLYAIPEGAYVVEGSATVSVDTESDNVLNITAASEKVVIDWHSFSIAENESVRFYPKFHGVKPGYG